MQHFLSSYGYLALLILTFLEAMFVPLPSEITLTFAGALAAGVDGGHLNIVLAILVGTIGETLGGSVGWLVGKVGGRVIVEKWGKYLLLSIKDLERTEKAFKRFGPIAVLVCRVLPVLRTFISLVAGIMELEYKKFVVFTFIGSLIWCAALVTLGYTAGSALRNEINSILSNAGYVLVALALFAVGYVLVHKLREGRNKELESTSSTDAEVK